VLSATINSTPANPTTLDVVTLTVQLQNSDGSAVPAIATYAWTGVQAGQATVASPAQTFPAGTNAVGVTVTTADGRTVQATASVSAVRPTLGAQLAADTVPGRINVPVTFTVSPVNLDGDTIVSVEWDFMTGTTDNIATVALTAPPFTYTVSAVYLVSAKLTTNTGRTATATLTLTVTP
jgi:hypothetical protein